MDDAVDFTKLEREFNAAVEADAKYQRENDAKFRAVEQRVASYEEFRDIVAASHLRSLDKKDIRGESARKQPWNPHAHKHESAANLSQLSPTTIGDRDFRIPQNAHEFDRTWRRSCKEESAKYQLLCRIGGERLQEIFRNEIGFGLLGEFVQVLRCCWTECDTVAVHGILQGLSKTNRFSLSVQFLNSEERGICAELFERLRLTNADHSLTEQHLSDLAQLYGLK